MSRGKYRTQLEWQALIEEQERSGLTGLEFCRRQGLFAKTFYRQRKKIRPRAVCSITRCIRCRSMQAAFDQSYLRILREGAVGSKRAF